MITGHSKLLDVFQSVMNVFQIFLKCFSLILGSLTIMETRYKIILVNSSIAVPTNRKHVDLTILASRITVKYSSIMLSYKWTCGGYTVNSACSFNRVPFRQAIYNCRVFTFNLNIFRSFTLPREL